MRVKPIGDTIHQYPVTPDEAFPMITVHNVHLLDASGSMVGGKYKNAIGGIKEEIALLANDKSRVKYTQTIIEFTSGWGIHGTVERRHTVVGDLKAALDFVPMGTDGGTPLYEALGNTLELMKEKKKQGEKVLVKVFTDGGENSSAGRFANPKVLFDLIKECEANDFTVTFVGTPTDTMTVIAKLGIDKSNTLTHNNTAEGVVFAFQQSASSTVSYSKSAIRGEDVTRGFYSKEVAGDK